MGDDAQAQPRFKYGPILPGWWSGLCESSNKRRALDPSMPNADAPITSALTRNEWLGVTDPDVDESEGVVLGGGHAKLGYFLSLSLLHDRLEINVHGPSPFLLDAEERHTLAALCLYGQAFGFTRQDLDAIRAVLTVDEMMDVPIGEPARVILRSLAARIEALLPPEKP